MARPTVAAICQYTNDEEYAIQLFGQAFYEVKRLHRLGVGLPSFVMSDTKKGLALLALEKKLAVLSNNISGVRNLLDIEQITDYFDDMIISEEVAVAKPNQEIFKIALKRMGVTPDEAIMVGDRIDSDIVPAKKIGMKTVLIKSVTFSNKISNSDERIPDIICTDLLELARIII